MCLVLASRTGATTRAVCLLNTGSFHTNNITFENSHTFENNQYNLGQVPEGHSLIFLDKTFWNKVESVPEKSEEGPSGRRDPSARGHDSSNCNPQIEHTPYSIAVQILLVSSTKIQLSIGELDFVPEN
jgi:hypothetical protein